MSCSRIHPPAGLRSVVGKSRPSPARRPLSPKQETRGRLATHRTGHWPRSTHTDMSQQVDIWAVWAIVHLKRPWRIRESRMLSVGSVTTLHRPTASFDHRDNKQKNSTRLRQTWFGIVVWTGSEPWLQGWNCTTLALLLQWLLMPLRCVVAPVCSSRGL